MHAVKQGAACSVVGYVCRLVCQTLKFIDSSAKVVTDLFSMHTETGVLCLCADVEKMEN